MYIIKKKKCITTAAILTINLNKKNFLLKLISENNFIMKLIFALSTLKRNLCIIMHITYIFTNKRRKKDLVKYGLWFISFFMLLVRVFYVSVQIRIAYTIIYIGMVFFLMLFIIYYYKYHVFMAKVARFMVECYAYQGKIKYIAKL